MSLKILENLIEYSLLTFSFSTIVMRHETYNLHNIAHRHTFLYPSRDNIYCSLIDKLNNHGSSYEKSPKRATVLHRLHSV